MSRIFEYPAASLYSICRHCLFSKIMDENLLSVNYFISSHIFYSFLGGDARTYCYTTELNQSGTFLRSLLKAQVSVQFCRLSNRKYTDVKKDQ